MILNIEVITRNMENPDEAPTRKIINHREHGDRIWLAKHLFWALRANRSVTTAPVIDQ